MLRKGFSFVLIFCFLFSCQHQLEIVEKPDDLIPADTFEMVLEDLMFLESFVRTKNKNTLKEFYRPMKASAEHLFNFYGVDSTRFVRSMDYYTRRQEQLVEMYKSIEENAVKRYEELDSLKNEE